jgi:hypothetical protein
LTSGDTPTRWAQAEEAEKQRQKEMEIMAARQRAAEFQRVAEMQRAAEMQVRLVLSSLRRGLPARKRAESAAQPGPCVRGLPPRRHQCPAGLVQVCRACCPHPAAPAGRPRQLWARLLDRELEASPEAMAASSHRRHVLACLVKT